MRVRCARKRMHMDTATFRQLDLRDTMLAELARQGFEQPTPIQAEAIPVVLSGRDLLASAQTGSGKTAAFVLPIIHLLAGERGRLEARRPRALILAPTRELAAQIGQVFAVFSKGSRVSRTVLFGGVGKRQQIEALGRGVDVVIATPGRLLDLMGEGALSLDRVQVIVLDEADRMLDMGFIPDVERIVKRLPTNRQSLFFSATLPATVVKLASAMLSEPVRLTVETTEQTRPQIEQQVMFVAQEDKKEALRMILDECDRALVFTRTKHGARKLTKYLVKNGIASDDLHGDKSQSARTRALTDFHSGRIRVLVATDIASRGIDVEDIDHVINYELPPEAESYVHRIGRTARAGKSGRALSLCDASELQNLSSIQKALDRPIPVNADHPYHCRDAAAAANRLAPSGARNPVPGRSRHRKRSPVGAHGAAEGRFAPGRGTALKSFDGKHRVNRKNRSAR